MKNVALEVLALPVTIAPDRIVAGAPTIVLKHLDHVDVDAVPDHSRLLILSRPDPEQGVAEIRLLTGWREKLR